MILSEERLRKARQYLQDHFLRLMAGDCLPPMRTMLVESGAGRTALEKALGEYASKGLIRRCSRVGYQKCEQQDARFVDIVACHDEGYSTFGSGFVCTCIQKLIRQIELAHYTVRIHSISLKDSLEQYLKVAGQKDSCGFVLIEPNMREMIRSFQLTGKPVVALFPQGRFPDVDQVVDGKNIVDMQMEYLFGLGHTRILYIREDFPFHVGTTMLFRRLEYFTIMSRHGIVVPAHWQNGYIPGHIRDALEVSFAREPYPTALIVYDTEVQTVYDFLRDKGFRIGKDVSVIATDGDAILSGMKPPVASVVSDSTSVVQHVWSLLQKQWANDFTPCTQEITLTLKEGLSAGSPVTITK